eukprot:Platyproteum_vivax@DN5026_c0_g1_i3.p1
MFDCPLIVLTGAGGVFGTALAKAVDLKWENAHFILSDRDKTSVEEMAQQLRNPKWTAVPMDLGKVHEARTGIEEALYKTLKAARFSSIVCFHNGFTMGPPQYVSHLEPEEIYSALSVNVGGQVALSALVIKAAKSYRLPLVLVTISDLFAELPQSTMSLLSLSKIANDGYMRVILSEECDIGVLRTLCYSPGPMRTPLFDEMLKSENRILSQGIAAILDDDDSFVPPDATATRLLELLEDNRYEVHHGVIN